MESEIDFVDVCACDAQQATDFVDVVANDGGVQRREAASLEGGA